MGGGKLKLEAAEWFIVICQIGFLPILAFLMRNIRSRRARAEALAVELVLKVRRPHVKRWESAWLVAAWLVLFLEGVISGGVYCPWEGVRAWRCSDQATTLRLKLKNAIVSCRLRPEDKEAVQMVLEKQP